MIIALSITTASTILISIYFKIKSDIKIKELQTNLKKVELEYNGWLCRESEYKGYPVTKQSIHDLLIKVNEHYKERLKIERYNHEIIKEVLQLREKIKLAEKVQFEREKDIDVLRNELVEAKK
jgi:hypothetical protein